MQAETGVSGTLARWGCLVLLAAGSCVDTIDNGDCDLDSDCGEASFCVLDIDIGTSYCTTSCQRDFDCPPDRECRPGTPKEPPPNDQPMGVCVTRQRVCEDTERCDGLDNDCDGVIDNAPCEFITGCLDDRSCGAFVCTAPVGQPDTICAPREAAANSYFQGCERDVDCPNGLCENAFCSPMCVPGDPTNDCLDALCARGVGDDEGRPGHNLCFDGCEGPSDCPGSTTGCVWRDLHAEIRGAHLTVCAPLVATLTPLGEFCPNNLPEDGDASCQYGLCLRQECTRICGGPGSDCSDVGPNHSCQTFDLLYGLETFTRFVCLE